MGREQGYNHGGDVRWLWHICRQLRLLLKGWSDQEVESGLSFGVPGLACPTCLGQGFREKLILDHGWVFEGDRLEECPKLPIENPAGPKSKVLGLGPGSGAYCISPNPVTDNLTIRWPGLWGCRRICP